jgi:hypothetical protein
MIYFLRIVFKINLKLKLKLKLVCDLIFSTKYLFLIMFFLINPYLFCQIFDQVYKKGKI